MSAGNTQRRLLMTITLLAPAALVVMVHILFNSPAVAGSSFVDTLVSLDHKHWQISNGWANGAHQNCTWSEANVVPTGGSVELVLNDEKSAERAFSCAEFQSNEHYGYGTYEVRMRSAAASGIVSAFFTYTGPGQVEGQPHDEIDFEFLGKDQGSVQLNYFADGKGGHEHVVRLDNDASSTFTDYAFEWLPNSIRWFVNGRLVHEVARKPGVPFPSAPSKIMLSIWNGTAKDTEAWLGRFAYPGKPLTAAVEQVSFTAAGDRCQFRSSVVCKEEPDRPPETPNPAPSTIGRN